MFAKSNLTQTDAIGRNCALIFAENFEFFQQVLGVLLCCFYSFTSEKSCKYLKSWEHLDHIVANVS